MGFDLHTYLRAERDRVQESLERAVAALAGAVPSSLLPVVAYGVLGGGKRLRPIMCVAAYRACGGGSAAIYDVAAALEMVHAYSLMHDDLPCMDDADLRRGRRTPHRVYGHEATLRAAALLIPVASLQAYRSALGLVDESTAREIVRELTRAAGAAGMVGGQALDLEAEKSCMTSAELDDLHGRKTGALMAASLRIGGLAAAAPTAVQDALDGFGKAVGLAFQIADDILDATASAEDLGKNPSDEARGKTTYVSLHGVEAAAVRAREEVNQARDALRGVGLEGAALEALAGYVVERTY